MLNNMAGWDRLGMAWRGLARQDKAGEARHGEVRLGLARRDKAGMARRGWAGIGLDWLGRKGDISYKNNKR